MFGRKKGPGPIRKVEGQHGWAICGLCGEKVPLIGLRVTAIDPMHYLVQPGDGAEEELHMLTVHGMLADDGAV